MENFDTIPVPVINDIVLQDRELKNYVEYILGKTNVQKSDLVQIKHLVVSGRKIDGQINIINFEELELFPNLESIDFFSVSISEENNLKFKRVKKISYISCEIENFNYLENLEVLSIKNSSIEDANSLRILSGIQELELDSVKGIENFEFLEKYPNLKRLKIKYMENFQLSDISFNSAIEFLSFEGIEEIPWKDLVNFKNLKTIVLTEKEAEKNNDAIEILKARGIQVIYNDIYYNVGEEYDQGI